MRSPLAASPDTLPNARDPRGRLTAAAVFPAGWFGHIAHRVTLGTASSTAPTRSEHVRVVHVAAPADRPALPPVLCIHGWGASAYGYRYLLGPLADAGSDAYAADLRGHGWSDKVLEKAAYTPAAFTDWTLRLLDALALERVVLVGHSLGGAITLHTTLRAPDRVAALVLLAPLGIGTIARLGQLRLLTPDLLGAWLPRLASPRAVTALALRSAYGRLGRPTARDVDEYWAPTADRDFARAVRLIAHAHAWPEFAPDVLARVSRPVELVAGTRDNLLRVDRLQRAATAIPDAHVDVVEDAGHVLGDEVPARVLAAVARAIVRGAAP